MEKEELHKSSHLNYWFAPHNPHFQLLPRGQACSDTKVHVVVSLDLRLSDMLHYDADCKCGWLEIKARPQTTKILLSPSMIQLLGVKFKF